MRLLPRLLLLQLRLKWEPKLVVAAVAAELELHGYVFPSWKIPLTFSRAIFQYVRWSFAMLPWMAWATIYNSLLAAAILTICSTVVKGELRKNL